MAGVNARRSKAAAVAASAVTFGVAIAGFARHGAGTATGTTTPVTTAPAAGDDFDDGGSFAPQPFDDQQGGSAVPAAPSTGRQQPDTASRGS